MTTHDHSPELVATCTCRVEDYPNHSGDCYLADRTPDTSIRFGDDPLWSPRQHELGQPTIRTYWTDCADCGRFVRIQSENSTRHDGTPNPPPTDTTGRRLCTGCGFDRLRASREATR